MKKSSLGAGPRSATAIFIRSTSVLALAAAAFAAAPAQAQDTPDAADSSSVQEQNLEVIVITGSNIRVRQDFKSPSPVQTFGQLEIQNTAPAQIQDVFKGMTVNSGSQTGNRQNNRQGVSQFSLRGLGLGSTLMLINGRRAGLAPVADETGTLFTDVNQYPVNMIERIEVLTDGASATYGSEAVAGVVNVITRKNFEGLEVSAEYRDTSYNAHQISGAFGSAFDRGHFSVFANYYAQGGNFRGDFDFIRDNINFSSSTGSPGSYRLAVTDPMTGRISATGGNQPDADCLEANAGFTPLNGEQIDSSGRCRYNFINQRRSIAEESRLQVFSQFDYDIRDNINFYSEVSYSRNEIRDAMGGAVNRTGSVNGDFFVPANHPFNFYVSDGQGGITYMDPLDAANAAAWAAGSLTAVDLAANFRPYGARNDGENAEDIVTVFNNIRVMTGLNFELSSTWNLDLNYTYATSEFTRREPRNWAVDRLQDLINTGKYNPFGSAIVRPDFTTPKTAIPSTASLTAANTEDVISQFARIKTDTGRVTQKVAEAILSGELGDFGTGPVGAAVGAQYRDVLFEDFPDGLSGALEGGREDPTEPVFGSQNAVALFGEIAVPFGDRVETQFAARYEDYGDQGGSTFDPKVAAIVHVTNSFAVRGSWGTSFQAPSVRQIAGSVGNAGVSDPQDPGPEFNVFIKTIGSDNLKPQSATNYNLGVVFQSDFGLRASVDYWHYKYEDLILPDVSPQVLIDNVGLGSSPRVLRSGSGQITGVILNFINAGDATAEGFDVKLDYSLNLEDVGTLSFNTAATIISKYRATAFTGLDGNGDLKGSRNFNNAFGSTPDLKLNGGVTFQSGMHEANLTVRHIGSYMDDQSGMPIDSQTTFDARYSVILPNLLGGGDTVLSAGVVNIFDKDPPLISNRPGFDEEVHDQRGRQIYVNVKQTF